MFTCAECQVLACSGPGKDNLPKNCPMNHPRIIETSLCEYKGEILRFARQSAITEGRGYAKWTRVEETIHFCKELSYQKIGIAFCRGMKNEAGLLSKILRAHGFSVSSVLCKCGGIAKEDVLDLKEEEKVYPGQYESMCNPIAQAMLLNEAKTEFNIAVGLCVGHDSLFFRYSHAPVTVLVAKDRVLAHNPAGALYCSESYYKKKVYP
ncbi:MAG: DUF1847 domain-containing protein [Peptococcaceae bacterium]|jgi:uncharacterized metal-binding protein|nr:DUF1847 domain-containing protein [Peptococcaceae bacterium]MDH7524610.1 DUF1847 domain-containing protein [Peptococcaceae bacterium]